MVTPLYMGSEGFQILLYGLWKMQKKKKKNPKSGFFFDYGQNVF